MELLFKTRSTEYTGPGELPNGSLDDTSNWQPMTKYLEAGADAVAAGAFFVYYGKTNSVLLTYPTEQEILRYL